MGWAELPGCTNMQAIAEVHRRRCGSVLVDPRFRQASILLLMTIASSER